MPSTPAQRERAKERERARRAESAAPQAAEQAAAEPEPEETVRGEPLPGESLRTPGDTEYIYLYDEPTCRICMRSWQNCECFR